MLFHCVALAGATAVACRSTSQQGIIILTYLLHHFGYVYVKLLDTCYKFSNESQGEEDLAKNMCSEALSPDICYRLKSEMTSKAKWVCCNQKCLNFWRSVEEKNTCKNNVIYFVTRVWHTKLTIQQTNWHNNVEIIIANLLKKLWSCQNVVSRLMKCANFCIPFSHLPVIIFTFYPCLQLSFIIALHCLTLLNLTLAQTLHKF